MDPYQHQHPSRNPAHPRDDTSAHDGTSNNNPPGTDAPESRNTPAAADRQPQYSGGFTVIPPNESRRSQINTVAQRELENYQRWKEANRVTSVHVTPEKLGGSVTLAEARQRQFTDARCSKLQKKLKKEELDRRRRQEEEEELQKMKTKQRETAERQEERRRREEQRRRQQLERDHLRKTETFLQRFERTAPGPLASVSATHTSSRSEAAEPRSVRDVQQDHRRVNSAFLDRLERGGGGSEASEEGCSTSDFSNAGQPLHLAHLDSEQSYSGWTEEADDDGDDSALTRLMKSFPVCSRVFLEEILDQCDGDYERADALLVATLT